MTNAMRDWASTLDWPDKLSFADLTPDQRVMVRTCPADALVEIEAEAQRRQVAMSGRMSAGQSSSIPVPEIAAMYRLRSFLMAREVVLATDQMWAAMTPDDWSWLRLPISEGGCGVQTPEAAQVMFGAIALEVAGGNAAKMLGDPTAARTRIVAYAPIQTLLRGFAPLRTVVRHPGGLREILNAKRLDDEKAAVAGALNDWLTKVSDEVDRRRLDEKGG